MANLPLLSSAGLHLDTLMEVVWSFWRIDHFSGIVFLFTVGLTLVLALLAPRHRRRQLRAPLLLLGAYLLLSLLHRTRSEDDPARLFLGACAFFCLLAALGFAVLLFLDVVVLHRLGKPLPTIALDLLRLVVLVAALIGGLARGGVNPGALFTGSAVLTAVLGLALRDTLGNLIAGLTFHLQPPFKVGDWIAFDQNPRNIGEVVEIDWRATRLVTNDQVEIVLPNGPLAQATIQNFSRPEKWSRRIVTVTAPFDVPPNRVRQLLLAAIQDSSGVCIQPAPSVLTGGFTDRGVEYQVRFFIAQMSARSVVESGVRDRIWYAFARAGITIPPATHAVTLTQGSPPPTRSEEEALAQRRRQLAGVPIFTALPEDALARLAGCAREQRYTAGEAILRQGEKGDSLFLIDQGNVVVAAREGEKPAVEVARLGPGAVFGEMSLLTGEPRTATVSAVEECRLLVVDSTALGPILRQSPSLAERISDILVERQAVLRSRLDASLGGTEQEQRRSVLRRICDFFTL